MARRKKKFYTVWRGTSPGVYDTWDECERVISGFSGAKYKSFATLAEAEQAYREGADLHWGATKDDTASGQPSASKQAHETARAGRLRQADGEPIVQSLCVDAACDMKRGRMEYRGVWYHDRSVAFSQGPFAIASNNVGEFLAIVHGLALLGRDSLDWPVYSDSETAIGWVKRRRVNSKVMQRGDSSPRVDLLVKRALAWLAGNEYSNRLLKWHTEAWGEVPADYGRK